MAMPRERIHIWVPNIIRTYDVYIAEHKSKTVTGLQMYVIAGGGIGIPAACMQSILWPCDIRNIKIIIIYI